ncbi:nucleotidyltransferase family protein [Haloimpatiens sp. FM7330]|uniref:nucleotidyltransferase family protein n=1 Tax=Haloimpatiens sp. FM7330 TaxID=3298610 RepID=UPI00363BBB14
MLNSVNEILVYPEYSIREVLKILDSGAKGIVFVIDECKKLLGTVTDGDIRRAILQDICLDNCIGDIMFKKPVTVIEGTSTEEIKEILIKNAVKQVPIIDENGMIKDMITINDILLPKGKENIVIIMAGGLGTRLKDLTKEIPKPMLKVGEDPILKHIIDNFRKYGYNKIFIAVNYKAEVIENYFQDGYAYGVKIEYIRENKRMGTAGGIKLAENYINKPFFVINGDIFTNLNIEKMMEFHIRNGFDITVGTRKHSLKIPYGVIESEDNNIKEIKEKPTIDCLINGGVYCLNHELLEYIPKNRYFEITDLISKCIEMGKKVGNYEIKDYWMDIGRIEDYHKVNDYVFEQIVCSEVGDEDD